MAKFIYKMQNILSMKEKLEDQAKTEFSAAGTALSLEEEKLRRIYEEIEAYQNQIRKSTNETLDIQEMKWCHEAIAVKKLQAEAQSRQVVKAERNLELARIKLGEVMIDRKTHEKLKEKAFEIFVKELDEVEKKEIDELTSFSYNNSN